MLEEKYEEVGEGTFLKKENIVPLILDIVVARYFILICRFFCRNNKKMKSPSGDCCYVTEADEHPGILSRWSWRRVLQFSGGIGLEPRRRYVFTTRNWPSLPPRSSGDRASFTVSIALCFVRVFTSIACFQTTDSGPDLEMLS